MGKYNNNRFQLAEYWLGQRSDSPAWYRCWMEGRRTRMASLGTTDFEEAKKKLTAWFVAEQSPKQAEPVGVPLADVLTRYYEKHGKLVRSAAQAKVGVEYWQEFWGAASVQDVANIDRQEEFHRWLEAKGLKASAVQRVLTVGRAAINRAYKRSEITAAPSIMSVKVPQAEPRGRPLSTAEIKALFMASAPHVRMYILWGLGTAARPEALLTMHRSQIDLDNGLIDLNPVGRTQNKKHRPVVRLIPTLAAHLPEEFLAMDGQTPIKSLKTAWKAAVVRSGLQGDVLPYSLRHTAARWMRARGVSLDDVALQLGHKRLGVTETYTAFSPDYLKGASEALEGLLRTSCAPEGKPLAFVDWAVNRSAA